MDWDLKMPPWDLAELEEGSSVVVGLGGGGCSSAGGLLDCSVDLKLGGLGEFGAAGSWTTSQQRKVLTAMVSTSSGPSRRARAMGHGGQIPSCLVDGCISDLSKCREYHRRHKVCEVHSKTAIVLVGGREQRFCQQCSRFHLLVEFDEVKRSCRKRLDGHNRRRRKPQPDLNSGSFITSHQGARFSSYSQIFPNPTSEPSWAARLVKMEQDLLSSHHHLPLHRTERHQNHISFSRGGYREGRQISFLPETVEASVCQPLLKSLSTPSESGGLARALDSDCALSLLSSPSHQISGISNLSQMVGARMAPIADRIPVGQPLVPGFGLSHYSSSQVASSVSPTGLSCSGTDEHVGTVLVAAASDANLHCYGLFRAGGEGPSDGSCPPFSW